MTRTPDEIKKGLECCVIGPSAHQPKCGECPYMFVPMCSDTFLKDALAYIQQLESDKQQLEGMLTHMNQLRDAAAGRALKMEERVHQLEAERDAAVADLKSYRCLETSVREQQEKQVFEAVQKYGVDVDRDELIKALAYDRAQHAQGYSDGRADAQRWISVEERLPDGEVLAENFTPSAFGYKECIIGYVSPPSPTIPDGYYAENEFELLQGVTHWMPLPEPPEEE